MMAAVKRPNTDNRNKGTLILRPPRMQRIFSEMPERMPRRAHSLAAGWELWKRMFARPSVFVGDLDPPPSQHEHHKAQEDSTGRPLSRAEHSSFSKSTAETLPYLWRMMANDALWLPTRTRSQRSRTPERSNAEVLGKLQALGLIVRAEAGAVEAFRVLRHMFVDEAADDLAVFEDEREPRELRTSSTARLPCRQPARGRSLGSKKPA